MPVDASAGMDARTGDDDASIGCGSCADGQSCIDGRCVRDADGDGVPADRDCDDDDPTVGSTAQRACLSDCGSGLERCEEGVWGQCDAPTDCDCENPGDQRTVSCPMCGTQTQLCVDGRWVNEGECIGVGECAAGDTEMVEEPCGLCGEGKQLRSRTCDSSCQWGEWSDVGECTGATAVCLPGTEDVETRICCRDGVKTRTRICTDACTFGDWSEWSECSIGECTPEEVRTRDEPCGQCNRGTHTVTEECDEACGWVEIGRTECVGAGPVCRGSGGREYCACEWGWVRQCCPNGTRALWPGCGAC